MADQPSRKRLRLQDFDYSSNGAYFVTICTQDKVCRFWNGNEPALNHQGEMVLYWLKEISCRFSGVWLDSYAIMPNHVHLLVFLSQTDTSLTEIVAWLKTMTTNEYIRSVREGRFPTFEKRLWQRSYYEHVIRNETDFTEIRKYISENPLKWKLDRLYSK